MAHLVLRSKIILRNKLIAAKNAAIGVAAITLLRVTRYFDAEKTGNFFARITRTLGPWWPENRVARANLVAAFPEKSSQEIDTILTGVWDNLGRVGAEFAHLDHIWHYDDATPDKNTVEFGPGTQERFAELKNDGQGALIFASHLGNWELPALAAAAHGLDSAVLFRRPNIAAADRAIQSIRAINMGEMIANTHDAPVRIAGMLQRGLHIGMLVDQHFGRGVDVTFFGRTAKANPLLARLVRRIDCPIHGVRVVRLPNGRFRVDLTERVEPARNASGEVDIQGTMQRVTSVIEGWVREHPEQWLWLHRRWR
ncbi:lipid A biosynthesis acyltransferase [Afipia carboxidovorans OM5]|uniref:Lauroyl/myristoyl acyltransferase n=1 Tax=Afipia carboxidovorans (strain ATCC 49405 / DSM 1227 / KCTC 32145 / OM5) TaxID=504832 RepID=B6JHS2_AFIC5|nr:lipid A biosynthesis lauroyl acyltransferase [Afipia carboxidovorans]ACI93615.1 lipid A biosynthesis acyltransferase [Afipia carboxidovorans OM5]AEI02694.1 lauroyl/myristoyl acyltransferase [Afipia carboxidovorans OM4]AEI06270.1 lauroyl/myristoyl acyltransferase [Afipia carboxidovorans OM5]